MKLFGGFELNDLSVHDAGEFVVARMVYHADVYYKEPSLLDDLV